MNRTSVTVPVLAYHSQNVAGNTYRNNDHIALERDLGTIAELGLSIVSLRSVAEWRRGVLNDDAVTGGVAISFDDGTNFDVEDLEFPPHGMQTAFLRILRRQSERYAMPAHATCFVMASPEARADMDRECLFGRGQIGDEWWREADECGLLAIENHGWDHSHPSVEHVVQRDQKRGEFVSIDTAPECDQHILEAGRYIAGVTRRRPLLFAYPFGESSDYLRRSYLPQRQTEHGLLAAFGTAPAHLSLAHDIWNLPRYVCGEHWHEPEQLRDILLAR